MALKYRAIYDNIKEAILQGKLSPGDVVASQRQLAKEKSAGVVTAARALDELARDGYVVRTQGRGTFVSDPSARRVGSAVAGAGQETTRRVGVILFRRHRNDPSYAELLTYLVQSATENECETRCWEMGFDVGPRTQRAPWERCDAVLVCGPIDEGIAREILWSGVPVVLGGMNPELASLAGKVDRVLFRYDEAARLSVAHLMDLGHERIGLINGETRIEHNHMSFREGYRVALAWNRLRFHPELACECETPVDPEQGYIAGRRLLSLSEPPTGIVCVTDRLAYGVCRAAAEMGLSVPTDLSVIGGENLPMSSAFHPPLTAIEFSHREGAETAMQLLLDRMGNPERKHQTVWLEPKLFVRSSCGPRRHGEIKAQPSEHKDSLNP